MRKTEQGLRSMLRKIGARATPSRMAILGMLERSRHPLSAQDIIDALGRDMDQATIYRTLNVLKEKGLIRQIDLRQNHAHYETYRGSEHHHLVCIRCGRIEDVDRCGIDDAAILRYSKYFSAITQHALEFYGICRTCVHKKRDRNGSTRPSR